MKQLNKAVLSGLAAKESVSLPKVDSQRLREKVLQFGTGILLRGLPDQYIQDANNQGMFNGSIVVVKSTSGGSVADFNDQDCLYTVCFKGISEGQLIQQYVINNSISRVLNAATQWSQILDFAVSDDLQIVTSNTTEVGMIYQEENILEHEPQSFPGRMLQLLFKRFQHFSGDMQKGIVIIPAELIEHNADVLKAVLLRLSTFNGLSDEFNHWLLNANFFCNTLVDRIVPGKLSDADQLQAEQFLGFGDKLMIMAEPFGLWAIESQNPRVKEILTFCNEKSGCFVVPSIEKFKELKLRLLNASHSFSCGVSLLMGIDFVRESMQHQLVSVFINKLATEEIVSTIESDVIARGEATAYAQSVLDRFCNPYLNHQWKSISAQYALKMKVRCIPLIKQYFERFQRLPEGMLIGFAAFLVREGIGPAEIKDNLSAESVWGMNLSEIKGLYEALVQLVEAINENNINSILEKYTTGV